MNARLMIGLLACGLLSAQVSPTLAAVGTHPLAPIKTLVEQEGVRVVVVDFYAHWCKTCKPEAAKWNALRQQLRSKGLRVVGVNSLEPNPSEACRRAFPLQTDAFICDVSGVAAETLGVSEDTGLPASFVWSWRGERLASKLSFEDAAKIIRRYLNAHPRLRLMHTSGPASEEGPAIKADLVMGLVKQELVTDGRFDIVSDQRQRAVHAKLRRESRAPGASAAHRCKLNAVVHANSVLEVALQRVAQEDWMLRLELTGAERSCVMASVTHPFDEEAAARSVRVAVAELLGQLRRPLEGLPMLYGGQRERSPDSRPSLPAQMHPPRDQGRGFGQVTFTSSPAGATVEVDSQLVCNKTPCSAQVALGLRDVEMKAPGHEAKRARVDLAAAATIRWALSPTHGRLSIDVDAQGLEVMINGAVFGKTPVEPLMLEPGTHHVAVGDRCHQREERRIVIKQGGSHNIALDARPILTQLKLNVTSAQGDSVVAEVSQNSIALGSSTSILTLPLCTKSLRVHHPVHGTWEQAISLQSDHKNTLDITLKPSGSSDPEVRYKQGLVCLATGDQACAIHHLKAAAELGRTETYGTLAELFVLESRWQECAHAVREYLLFHPRGSDAQKVRGYIGLCQANAR